MRPTWKQLVRFTISFMLMGAFIGMFMYMGISIVRHATNTSELASWVTGYATFIGIVGVLVSTIIKDLFNDE